MLFLHRDVHLSMERKQAWFWASPEACLGLQSFLGWETPRTHQVRSKCEHARKDSILSLRLCSPPQACLHPTHK